MDFIQHTTHWVKGEILEATIFGSFGFLSIICALLFWQFGVSPNTKAVIIPLVLVGGFFVLTAIAGILHNKKRLTEYPKAFQKDKIAFVKSEKKRVEDFQYLYKITILIASISFALAICFFLFTNNHILKAIGLSLTIWGLAGLVIDYFSKERADTYYKAIASEIKSHGT